MTDLTPLREALAAVDPGGEDARRNGWTPSRRRTFLEAISEGKTVEAACGLIGLSVASAYALRRRAEGEAFALGWRAACLLARDRLTDIFTSRAIDGQLDTWVRADGQEVTRHRYDNRLGLAMLARLDRLAQRPAVTAPADAPLSPDDPHEAAIQIAADFPGFLDLVEADADIAAVRAWVAEGMRRRLLLPQLGLGPPGVPWWVEEDEWRTALPPPPGFVGDEWGEPGDPDYCRTLTVKEARAADMRRDVWIANMGA